MRYLFPLFFFAASLNAAHIQFTFVSADSTTLTNNFVRLIPTNSTPSASGVGTVANDWLQKRTDTNGVVTFSNILVPHFHAILSGPNGSTVVRLADIPVNSNAVLYATNYYSNPVPPDVARYLRQGTNVLFVTNSGAITIHGTAVGGAGGSATNAFANLATNGVAVLNSGQALDLTNRASAGSVVWDATASGNRAIIGGTVDLSSYATTASQNVASNHITTNATGLLAGKVDENSGVLTNANHYGNFGFSAGRLLLESAKLQFDNGSYATNTDTGRVWFFGDVASRPAHYSEVTTLEATLEADIATKQNGSAILTNISGTGALTNITSGNSAFTSLLRQTNQPIVKTISAGSNVTLTDNVTNIVLAASGGSGSVATNAEQFAANPVLTIKDGANLTNVNFWGTSIFADLYTGSFYVTNSVYIGGPLTNAGATYLAGIGGTGNNVHLTADGLAVRTNLVFQGPSAILTNISGTGALTNITSANSAFTSLLQVSNQPVVKTVSAGANTTITDNGTNLVVASSGGAASLSITNITVSATNNVIVDLAAFDIVKISLLTNLNMLILSNASTMNERGQIYFQQDTNGQRLIANYSVSGGVLQTNANMQPTTNASALDLLEVMPGFFSTNLLAWWPQNFQPRVAFTNSLSTGGGGGGYDPSADTAAVTWYRVEGTTGTNSVNSAITNLVDRKGGTPFTNLTALAAGPIMSNSVVNGKAAAYGFGTNWLAAAVGNYAGLTAAHFFIVIKANTDNGSTIDGPWKLNGQSGQNVYYPFGTDIYSDLGSSTRHNGDPTTSIDAWRLLEIVSVAGEWTLYLDGVQQFTDASNTVLFNASGDEILFANAAGASGFLGAIAEIIVRDTRATGGTLSDIRAYFDSEYNLAY